MLQLVDERYVAQNIARTTNHDEILMETLRAWYSRRPSLRDVTAFVAEGVAILRGSVVSNRDRILAVELAWDAGAEEVRDELMLTWPLAA